MGGTSLAAPLFAGFYSRIQAAHGNTLGFPALALYSGAAANPAWFHDITSGGNGGSPHVTGELFKMMAGVDMQHVPILGYKRGLPTSEAYRLGARPPTSASSSQMNPRSGPR